MIKVITNNGIIDSFSQYTALSSLSGYAIEGVPRSVIYQPSTTNGLVILGDYYGYNYYYTVIKNGGI